MTSHASNPERPNIPERDRLPELPRLRVLENQAVEMPVSVSSAASSASPRSGSSRVHPYNPVGEAVEGSSFEVVPSIATRAPSISGRDESMDMTPIRRSNSSPVIQHDPSQLQGIILSLSAQLQMTLVLDIPLLPLAMCISFA